MLTLAGQYTFVSGRFALRGWAGHGGVIYDEADSSLYEVSEAAYQLLSLAVSHTHRTAAQLAQLLLEELPQEDDVQLVESLLAQLAEMGVVRCLPA